MFIKLLASCNWYHFYVASAVSNMDFEDLYDSCKLEMDNFVQSFVHYSYLKAHCKMIVYNSKCISNDVWGERIGGDKLFALRIYVRNEEDLKLLKHMLYSIGSTIILSEDQDTIATVAFSESNSDIADIEEVEGNNFFIDYISNMMMQNALTLICCQIIVCNVVIVHFRVHCFLYLVLFEENWDYTRCTI